MSSKTPNASQSKPKEQNSSYSKGKPCLIERIKQEITAQSEGQEEIIEFSFDSIPIERFTPEISNLFQKYPKLISLEFNDCHLVTLEGFPVVKQMVKLCLEENKLGNDALQYIVDNFKELQFLSLSNNNISSLESLKILSKLPALIQLDLQENPVSELPNYRETLFKSCEKLDILDNKDKAGISIQYSDDDEDDDVNNINIQILQQEDKEVESDYTDNEEDYEEGEEDGSEEEDDDEGDQEDEPRKKKK